MENTYFEHFCLQRSSVREGPLADSLHFERKRFPLKSSLECISWQRPTVPLIIDSLKGEKSQESFLPECNYSVLVYFGSAAFEWFFLIHKARERWADGSSLSALIQYSFLVGGVEFDDSSAPLLSHLEAVKRKCLTCRRLICYLKNFF